MFVKFFCLIINVDNFYENRPRHTMEYVLEQAALFLPVLVFGELFNRLGEDTPATRPVHHFNRRLLSLTRTASETGTDRTVADVA